MNIQGFMKMLGYGNGDTQRWEDGSARVGQINIPAGPRPYGRERRFEDGSMITQEGMRVPAFDSPDDFDGYGQMFGGLQQTANPQMTQRPLRVTNPQNPDLIPGEGFYQARPNTGRQMQKKPADIRLRVMQSVFKSLFND